MRKIFSNWLFDLFSIENYNNYTYHSGELQMCLITQKLSFLAVPYRCCELILQNETQRAVAGIERKTHYKIVKTVIIHTFDGTKSTSHTRLTEDERVYASFYSSLFFMLFVLSRKRVLQINLSSEYIHDDRIKQQSIKNVVRTSVYSLKLMAVKYTILIFYLSFSYTISIGVANFSLNTYKSRQVLLNFFFHIAAGATNFIRKSETFVS